MKSSEKRSKVGFVLGVVLVTILMFGLIFGAIAIRMTRVANEDERAKTSNFEIVGEVEDIHTANEYYPAYISIVCDKNTQQLFYLVTYHNDVEFIPLDMTKEEYLQYVVNEQ